MSNKNKCCFCLKEFSTKSNLNRHQSSSKTCLNNEKRLYKCEFCLKEITSRENYTYHLSICKEKEKDTKNTERTNQIEIELKTLKKELEKIKDKPTTTNNNITITTNNTDNSVNYCGLLNYMTPEVVRESFKNFNINNLLSGSQKELADMTIKNFLTGKDHPLYLCKDRSRNKFVYTDEENKEKEDANAIVLRTLVYNGIAPLLKKLYHEEYVKLHDELARCKRIDDRALIDTSRDDIKELDEAYKQFNILKEAEDYISHLSKCLPTSIKDRIYKDGLKENLELEERQSSSDVEFHKQLEMIGDYTASELNGFKDIYKKTGVIKGPKDLIQNKDLTTRYVAFLKEDF